MHGRCLFDHIFSCMQQMNSKQRVSASHKSHFQGGVAFACCYTASPSSSSSNVAWATPQASSSTASTPLVNLHMSSAMAAGSWQMLGLYLGVSATKVVGDSYCETEVALHPNVPHTSSMQPLQLFWKPLNLNQATRSAQSPMRCNKWLLMSVTDVAIHNLCMIDVAEINRVASTSVKLMAQGCLPTPAMMAEVVTGCQHYLDVILSTLQNDHTFVVHDHVPMQETPLGEPSATGLLCLGRTLAWPV